MDMKIYRGSWRRGGDTRELTSIFGNTALLDSSHGMMCCLGQCALQLGASINDIDGVGEPGDVATMEPLAGVLVYQDDESGYWKTTKLSTKAMSINDNEALTQNDREKALADLFAQEGHILCFVDGPAPWLTKSVRSSEFTK